MKKLIAATLACMPAIAAAQGAAPAPTSPVTGNMAIVSDYRFRGISQSYLGPAIQGGIDYAHPSGFYIGNWNSSVSSLVYTGGSGIEMDFYGGYKKTYGDIGTDFGFIYYYYPNAEFMGKKFNNQELYAGASWKWISAKLNYAISDYFGLNSQQAAGGYWVNKSNGVPLDGAGSIGKSKGTYYLDVTAAYPASAKLNLVAHWGYLDVKAYNDLDYSDWKVGVTYDVDGWLLGASYVDTSAKNDFYYTTGSKGPKDTGNSTVVLSIGKTF
jgi:uncharacterized protein (TIGR02001 family)